ncbi:CPBP family intramembrane metalloprotease [Candidatus Saccharibacteria bacterium]|nr:CPBP family intramembrane metalloprotease [Candidatus Saccharibacteria bacterium]
MLKDFSKRLSHRPEKPKIKGWGPVSAVLFTLLIYFGSQIVMGLLFGVYVGLAGLSEAETTRLFEKSTTAQFVFVFGVAILSLWFLYGFMKRRSISFADLALKKPSFDNILLALPVFVVYFITLICILSLVSAALPSINLDQEQQIGFENATGYVALTMVFISLVVLPAFVEEVMVRGFLYGGLVKKFRKLSAALIASLIFGFAHLQLGSGESPLWVAAIDTFILSMFLIWLRERTGNLWAGIFVHGLKNSLAFITIFILNINV